ncbi:MAG: insulinase family protein, partial [Micavibrio sp.]|nr:insulinase family protein [Micavibrio sp.]
NARAFPDHPYGVPIIGWMDEIAELTYEDAKSYYKKWYAPNNAILIITGDVTPADVFAKAIDIYGDIEKIELPERDYVSHPEIKAQQKIVTYDPDVREAALIQIYRAPSAIENKQDALALRVLSEILGGGPSSRLYQSLVTRQKLASSISFNYDDLKSANGSIIISATPLPDKTVQRVEKAITAELDTLVNKGISDQELMDAVTRLKDSAVYARDSLSGPAMIIGRAMSVGMSLDDIEYWPHDISTVTKVHVEYVANTYLNPESITPVTGYLLPESKRPEGEKPEAESTKKIETEPETDIEDKIEDEVKDEVEDRAGDVKPDRATEDKSQDMPDQDEDVDAASDEQETTEAKPPTEEEAKTESTSQSAPSHNE